MKYNLFEGNIPNIPWEDMPAGYAAPVWRYARNPVIGRNPVKNVMRIFNSAVVPYKGGFTGVFRGETNNGIPFLFLGESADGISWQFDEKSIDFIDEEGNPYSSRYYYDPRVVYVDGLYYVIWCTDFCGASLGIAYTNDFKRFVRINNPFLPFNRNGVLFPKKINGKFLMLTRPSDSGHTPFGDVFLSESGDVRCWGNHKHVMGKSPQWWQSVKIGAGAAPIETSEGWLLFYHGAAGTCNGFVYSMGGAILDRDKPSIVKFRCENFLLTPETEYEERGFVPNVVFPCAALTDAATGKIAIYYGAADSCVAICFTELDKIIDYIKDNSLLNPGDADEGR
jgi:beta-1,4-mannooligosaccharide/beta-1,4-mannosyl-N-acetylglucosamine phosphorylase